MRGEVEVEIPIYCRPEAHEDVFIKMNSGAEEAEYGELITRKKIMQIHIGSEVRRAAIMIY